MSAYGSQLGFTHNRRRRKRRSKRRRIRRKWRRRNGGRGRMRKRMRRRRKRRKMEEEEEGEEEHVKRGRGKGRGGRGRGSVCRTSWDSPLSVLRLLQELDYVSAHQGDVSALPRLVGQLHPETAAVALQHEKPTNPQPNQSGDTSKVKGQ